MLMEEHVMVSISGPLFCCYYSSRALNNMYVWDVISCPCMQTSMNVATELKAVNKCATTPKDPITASATMDMN